MGCIPHNLPVITVAVGLPRRKGGKLQAGVSSAHISAKCQLPDPSLHVVKRAQMKNKIKIMKRFRSPSPEDLYFLLFLRPKSKRTTGTKQDP